MKIIFSKLYLSICLILIFSVSFSTKSSAQGIDIIVDDNFISSEVAPFIENGRTMVPIRIVSEALNYNVMWNEYTREVQITNENTNLNLKIDSDIAIINGDTKVLDSTAKIINGRTFVPLRFIAEEFGAFVQWIPETRQVKITQNYNNEKEDIQVDDKDLSFEELEKKYNVDLDYLTANERKLADLVNEYRDSIGKPRFKISKSLTKVARYHVLDQNKNNPADQVDARGLAGNSHSWSAYGPWKAVVYTPDHTYAKLMYSKPSELTNYNWNGYEISVRANYQLTPESALSSWQGSAAHNAVIVGEGPWEELTIMGIGIQDGYSNIWFGKEADPEGYY